MTSPAAGRGIEGALLRRMGTKPEKCISLWNFLMCASRLLLRCQNNGCIFRNCIIKCCALFREHDYNVRPQLNRAWLGGGDERKYIYGVCHCHIWTHFDIIWLMERIQVAYSTPWWWMDLNIVPVITYLWMLQARVFEQPCFVFLTAAWHWDTLKFDVRALWVKQLRQSRKWFRKRDFTSFWCKRHFSVLPNKTKWPRQVRELILDSD